MNYLQLCQRVARESGTIAGTLPTTVTGQSGRLLKIVGWVASAWTSIQTHRGAQWQWMRKSLPTATTLTIPGTACYTAASWNVPDLERWHTDRIDERPVSLYLHAAGVSDEGELQEVSWPDWRRKYGRGAQVPNRPIEYAISPANEMCLGPVPDAAYVVNGEYWKTPQTLAADADVPDLPSRHHELIVCRALMSLAEHDEAGDAYAAASSNFLRMMADLERDQLPVLGLGGGPLA